MALEREDLKKYSFWIEQRQLDALRFVANRDGIRESEQIRRAIDWWVSDKLVPPAILKPKTTTKTKTRR